MPQSNAVKISMSVTGRYQLHQESLRQGRPPSEIARRFVESGLAKSVNAAPPDPEISTDKIERSARGNKVAAVYLSGPLASAIKNLSVAESRSQSHVLRDLLRCELRRRGLLPNDSYSGGSAPVLENAAP
jgi:hypothetical protein